MIRIPFLLIIILLTLNLRSQEYFQQEVNFDIAVKLNDSDHSLKGFEKIEYINNSPDTLEYLYFHLWPNAYQNKNTALAQQQIKHGNNKLYYAETTLTGFIDSLNFKSDKGKILIQYDKKHRDICKLLLETPLNPGDTIHISTPFYVKIPSSDFSRLGHNGQSYQITQWYPKPAVYDKYGWHPMPYLDIGEFYAEFGSYNVKITLPENYVVGATGNLQEATEEEWLNEIAEKTAQIKIYDENDNNTPKSSETFKTITFKEKDIHDFAWFADKRFHVLKGSVKLPESGKSVTTWAMFTNYDANTWKKAIEYINDALVYYSEWYGDYPYKTCTAVESSLSAGGGMEYPTITVIGYSGSDLSLEEVIMHEVGHNWFYGILGSDERANPWMDEGINSFSEMRYLKKKHPSLRLYHTLNMPAGTAEYFDLFRLPLQSSYELAYMLNAKRNLDQAGNLHSEEYLAMNYFTITYMKNAFSFFYLYNYLGEETFDKIMKEYYQTWKFKHPYPEDLIKIFEKNTNKDLDWFFDDLLGSTKKIDYKIKRLKKSKKEGYAYCFKIKNIGNIKSPVNYSLIKDDEIIKTIWTDGFEKEKVFQIRENNFDLVKLDAINTIPDINKRNNSLYKNGLIKNKKTFNLKFLGAMDNPEKNQLFYLPAFGWNKNNGFMMGIAMYNNLLPMKRLEYQIIPLYGFGNNDIAGCIRAQYHLLPLSYFQRVDFSVSSSQFALNRDQNFQRINVTTDLWIKNRQLSNNKENHILISATSISDYLEMVVYDKYVNKLFLNLSITHENKRKINPYSIGFYSEGRDDYIKSWVEYKYKVTYNKIRKGLKIRLFAGAFLYESNEDYLNNYRFKLSGTYGNLDYKYDHILLNRSLDYLYRDQNSLFNNQFVNNEGGFAHISGIYSNQWMLSGNISTSLPIPLPIKLYANFGSFADIEKQYGTLLIYDLGVSISIADDIFEIFFPVINSESLKNYSSIYHDNYLQKIRFTLNLNYLDPVKFVKNFKI